MSNRSFFFALFTMFYINNKEAISHIANHCLNILTVYSNLLMFSISCYFFVPIAIIVNVFHFVDNVVLFGLSILALIPLAKLVGDTTEHLADHYGVTGGSLINVIFSNMPEIILSIIAIQSGLFDLVKANIVGSILGEILLVLGLSLVVGGLRYREQIFNKENIVFHTSTLFLAVVVLSIHPILITGNLMSGHNAENDRNLTGSNIAILSNSFAFILIDVYAFGLVFTFRTHEHLFAATTTIEKTVIQILLLKKKKI